MYHVESEGNVDVELLAECGQIAQRLRDFEKDTWCIDLKELQRKSLCSFGAPPLASSHSITQKLNDIFDINENADNSTELVNHLKYLEDTVIKVHYQQELLRQTNQHHKRIQNIFYIKNNMNYSASSGNNSGSNNNNDNDLIASPTLTTAIHSIDQQHNGEQHERQLSATTTTTTGSRDNNNKSIHDDDDDDDKKDQNTTATRQSQNFYNPQQQCCAGRITNDDLNILLRELKRKIDYTEKMNWLCKFFYFFTFYFHFTFFFLRSKKVLFFFLILTFNPCKCKHFSHSTICYVVHDYVCSALLLLFHIGTCHLSQKKKKAQKILFHK